MVCRIRSHNWDMALSPCVATVSFWQTRWQVRAQTIALASSVEFTASKSVSKFQAGSNPEVANDKLSLCDR